MPEWLVVLGPAGTVLAVSGAPAAWIGLRLHLAEGVAPRLREAAGAAVRAVHREAGPVATEIVPEDGNHPAIRLLAIEAVRLVRVPTDVRGLLGATMEVMRKQAAAIDASLDVEVDPALPSALAFDPDKIGWAVTTLVGNALRYVKPGSRRMPGGSIAVRAAYDGAAAEVVLEIQDDGPGIPADRVPLLLRPDERARSAGQSLLLIQDVLEAHGGGVEIESSTDAFAHGTTVRLRFPARST